MIPTGTCPNCGAPYRPGTTLCEQCGTALPPPQATAAPTANVSPQIGRVGAAPAVKGASGLLVAGALLAVIALIGIIFLATTDDKSSSSKPTGSTTPRGLPSVDAKTLKKGEVFLEPLNQKTRDPFTDDSRLQDEVPPVVLLPELPLPSTTTTTTVAGSTGTTVAGGGTVSIPSVGGDEPGLYGGTRDQQACDREKMIKFLETHPDKAAAWAKVQGIPVADIRKYMGSLKAVYITHDMRVTNHGFRDGEAYAHPSVLQAGTAIYIDEFGLPRAKCSCGNPLQSPTPVEEPIVYVGDAWPSFKPQSIIIARKQDPIGDTIKLVDLDKGGLFDAPMGGSDEPVLATGDVQVTVRWSDHSDIDLSVKDPAGATVDFDFPSSPSGGKLDVDANGNCETFMSSPVENIVWPKTAPPGKYTVTLELYDECATGSPHGFTLTVLIGGKPAALFLADGTTPFNGIGSIAGEGTKLTFVFTRA